MWLQVTSPRTAALRGAISQHSEQAVVLLTIPQLCSPGKLVLQVPAALARAA